MSALFDGVNKLIILENGVTEVDIKSDIYSTWKSWMTEGDNSKYLPAISCVGGDPISEITSLGTTYFLENGWKIRPFEGSHSLTISGNIFTRDGSSPFVNTLGNYNVMISLSRSNLIDTVATGGSSGGGADASSIATAVWNKNASTTTNDSFGKLIKTLEEKVDIITALSAAGL